MKEKEYLRLKAKLEADYRRQLDALDTVFRMDGGNPQTASRSAQNAKKQERTTRGELSTAIDEILPAFGHQSFTAAAVFLELKKTNPDINSSSVSSAITRLAEGDEARLIVLQQGKGRRATVYKNRSARMEKVS